MYYDDLVPYHYNLPLELSDVFTIGWLSRTHKFRVGQVSQDATEAMEELVASSRTNKMRGYHLCEFCDSREPIVIKHKSEQIALGSAEIWIPSTGGIGVFAAPDLVYHYVVAHMYLPPQDFINAVLAARNRSDWNPNHERQIRVQAAFASRK